MKGQTLWTRNYTLLISASILGAAGGIAGSYAMSFLVFDETGSTLAAGFLIALRIIPQFLLPILIAPILDRLPRKPFLVYGDLISGFLYAFAGVYLRNCAFSYTGYLLFSLLLNCIGAFDSLAYTSILPKVIPEGFEGKGYTVSGMLYPVMNVLVMPLAALLLDTIGVANILLIQGGCSILAAMVENGIKITERVRSDGEKMGISLWWQDFLDGFRYLKGERGLMSIFAYMGVTNGAAMGFSPILIAFFRTAPGFSAFMYSLFSVAEFAGRSLGGLYHFHIPIPGKRRYGFAFAVYQIYEVMDMILLWLPYPLMLVNRVLCGFLGINSATLREAAVQSYLPEEYRARVNAFEDGMISAAGSLLALIVGMIGEFLDYRTTVSLTAGFCILACWLTIWRNKKAVQQIYEPMDA